MQCYMSLTPRNDKQKINLTVHEKIEEECKNKQELSLNIQDCDLYGWNISTYI